MSRSGVVLCEKKKKKHPHVHPHKIFGLYAPSFLQTPSEHLIVESVFCVTTGEVCKGSGGEVKICRVLEVSSSRRNSAGRDVVNSTGVEVKSCGAEVSRRNSAGRDVVNGTGVEVKSCGAEVSRRNSAGRDDIVANGREPSRGEKLIEFPGGIMVEEI